MTAFRRRPGLVEAVQWTGVNEDEIRDIWANAPMLGLDVGDWIIRDASGVVTLFTAEEFAETFEPADDVEASHA
jgi:hypothetical protein